MEMIIANHKEKRGKKCFSQLKKVLLIGALVVITFSVLGQDEPYGYITKEPVVVYGYDLIHGVSDPQTVKIANPNLKFRQIGDVRQDANLGQVFVIQFWTITDEPSEISNDFTKINKSSTSTHQFYCVKSSDYKEPAIVKRYKTRAYNAKPIVGTLIVPIKFRPAQGDVPFDFTTDFTLGSSFGYSFRMSHYRPSYLSIVGVFGVTSVGVDSLTTKGFVTEPNTKLSAITPGIGAIIDISGFQIGAVVGWDVVGGTTGKKWIYNGKPWLSFGIGYQFLRKNEDK
jgi:hypothetical protein